MPSFFNRSVLARLAVALLAAGSIASIGSTPATADPIEDQTTIDLINQARAAVHACPLVLNIAVDDIAKNWAGTMANVGVLSHNMVPFVGRNISGENVGYGADIFQVNNLFLGSPIHYANMVNPTFTSVGVGVTHLGARTWVTYDFLSTDFVPHFC